MDILNQMLASLPNLLVAILFLILAFVVATIAKSLVVKLLKTNTFKSKLARMDQEKEGNGLIETLGKVAFLLVFLLFLPSVLNRLNMTGVSEPITNFVSSVVSYIPLLVAAGVIVYVGFFVANMIKDITSSVLSRVGIDRFQAKYAPVKEENAKLSNILATILYVLILIPVITAALQILGLDSIANPLTELLNNIIAYIPRIFVAGLLVFIGIFVSNLVVNLLRGLIQGANIDRLGKEFGLKDSIKISTIVSEVVRYALIVFFTLEAVKVLNLEVLTTIVGSVVAYLPIALGAGLIILAAIVLSNMAEKFIKSNNGSNTLVKLVNALIYVVAGFMTLSQLGIGTTIVEAAFVITLAAVGIAFAIAFGIGGKDFAKKKLSEMENKADKEIK